MLHEAPRPGQTVCWRDDDGNLKSCGKVLRIDGNLCWLQPEEGEAAPFIWRFKDGLNKLAEIV